MVLTLVKTLSLRYVHGWTVVEQCRSSCRANARNDVSTEVMLQASII